MLAHLANVAEVLPKLLADAEVNSLRWLGPTNDDVQKALSPMGATLMATFASAKIAKTI